VATQNTDNCSDELAVFQTYVDLINSERETIWARNNALLVANSLILGAIVASPSGLWEQRWVALSLLGAGLFITLAWGAITVAGWHVLERHVKIAASLSSPCFAKLPKPFSKGASHHHERGSIFILTLCMIGLFALIYVVLGYFRLFL
jgi:hypothetical protein